jgi:L-cysteine desulfidase
MKDEVSECIVLIKDAIELNRNISTRGCSGKIKAFKKGKIKGLESAMLILIHYWEENK